MTEFERKAVTDYDCPIDQCRRDGGVKGEPCLKMSATNNYWDRRIRKHPHPERVALARPAKVDGHEVRTKSGRLITEGEIAGLAAEAEEGYDVLIHGEPKRGTSWSG